MKAGSPTKVDAVCRRRGSVTGTRRSMRSFRSRTVPMKCFPIWVSLRSVRKPWSGRRPRFMRAARRSSTGIWRMRRQKRLLIARRLTSRLTMLLSWNSPLVMLRRVIGLWVRILRLGRRGRLSLPSRSVPVRPLLLRKGLSPWISQLRTRSLPFRELTGWIGSTAILRRKTRSPMARRLLRRRTRRMFRCRTRRCRRITWTSRTIC